MWSTFINNSIDDYATIDHIMNNGINLSSKLVLLLSGIVVMTGLANVASGAQGNFVAGLTGHEVVPPVGTNAQASARIEPMSGGKLIYILNVTDISNVTQAQMYLGKQGENGTVMVTLFSSEYPISHMTGTLSRGNITPADLQGPMKGKQLSDLISLMQHGGDYVSVITRQNPNGEVRGQIGIEGIDETGTTLGENSLNITLPSGEE
jgi:hypothetical protein